MMTYAPRRVPQLYRNIDLNSRVEGASPHQLVQILFDELLSSVTQAELCVVRGDLSGKSDRVSRALSILVGLEASLDFERGGSVAQALGRSYDELRRRILGASIANDPAPFRAAAADLVEIADAWRRIG